jgi:histidinol dehydrogenase
MIRRLSTQNADFFAQFTALLDRATPDDVALNDRVRSIIQAVRSQGDAALLDYTQRFDRRPSASVADLRIPQSRLAAAWQALPEALKTALEQAANRIRTYAEHQSLQGFGFVDDHGNRLGQRITPLDAVGLYVPGGKAAYPSSVLMNAIPAKVAGVSRLVMVTPTPDGLENPTVLAAAYLAGVDEVFSIGGAQAVAALAYGTESLAPVDKIVGPGNAYVAEAKRQVFGQVGIDAIAGPSEILILADASVSPDWLAMDLLGQAEHDEMAQSILISPDAALLDAAFAALERRLPALPRAAIAGKALQDRGALIHVQDWPEALKLANHIAAEHLELAVADPHALLPHIRHAGAIFIGAYSPESFGDYCAGPNHVLPTSRAARFSGPLGVYEFQKRSSLIECSAHGAKVLAPIAAALAEAEGLQAHGLSAVDRL